MIKPTKLINTIIDAGTQVVSGIGKKAGEVTEQVAESLPRA